MAFKLNLVIDQGADCEFPIDIADNNDQPIDLTGFTGEAEMRKHYTSSNGYSFSVQVANSGTVTLSMNAVTTNSIAYGRYVYDCELTGADNKVSRIVEGIVTVNPRVNKT